MCLFIVKFLFEYVIPYGCQNEWAKEKLQISSILDEMFTSDEIIEE